MIDNPSPPNQIVIVGNSLTLSCTSQGSPPDTFTLMKDGIPVTPIHSVTAVIHTETMAIFRLEHTIYSVTTNDNGTYTCTVTNPIGTDSETITVNVGMYL